MDPITVYARASVIERLLACLFAEWENVLLLFRAFNVPGERLAPPLL